MEQNNIHNSLPLVSVVVPVFNMEAYVGDTLRSILATEYPALEVIIVNDGSTDDSLQVISETIKGDPRVRVITQENAGVCQSRNRAITEANGEYIFPMDADNLLEPDFIARAVEAFTDPAVKAVAPTADFFGDRQGLWHLPPFSLRIMARRNILDTCALYRRTDWELTGGYCEYIKGREDWEFWVNVLKNGGKVVRLPGVALHYRIRKMSKRITDRQLKRHVIDVMNERHPEFFQHQLGGPLHYYRSWSRILNVIHHFLYPRHLTIANEFRQTKDFFLALPSIFRTNRGEVIYKGRNEIRHISFKNCDYVVKAFHMPNMLNRIVYGLLRPSKAKRSYHYSLLLQEHGIGVPTPVGYYSERFLGLFFGRSYYISLLSPLPYTYNNIVNGNLSPTDEIEFLKAIGLTTARLHNAEMIHHDYSRGNLLLGKDSEGKACVELIDLNRLSFHKISMDEGCQNFAERLPATDVQRHTMAEAYAKERGFDVERCYELMLKYNKEKT